MEKCRCDDTDGEGIGDVEYIELLEVDREGVITTLGTYDVELTAPYTPVAPAECAVEGAELVIVVQVHRIDVSAGGFRRRRDGPPSVGTATAHGGPGRARS